jgi:hypothetical protein
MAGDVMMVMKEEKIFQEWKGRLSGPRILVPGPP